MVIKKLEKLDNTMFHALYTWLISQESLTERLRLITKEVRLEVVKQRFENADNWDHQIGNVQEQNVFHREIIMWGDQVPCWYARTTIPVTTYQTDPLFFGRLEQESLGDLIFNESRIKRVEFMNYPVEKNSAEYRCLSQYLALETSLTLWARLSKFTFCENLPFCLIEILLPELMRLDNCE